MGFVPRGLRQSGVPQEDRGAEYLLRELKTWQRHKEQDSRTRDGFLVERVWEGKFISIMC